MSIELLAPFGGSPRAELGADLHADLVGALETVRGVADEVLSVRRGVESAKMGSQEWVELAALARQVESAAAAVGLAAGVRVAATDEVVTEDGELVEVERGLDHHRLDAPDLMAPAWGCTPRYADSRLCLAAAAATRVPGLLGALASGVVTDYGVRVVVDTTRDLDETQCALVVRRLMPWLTDRAGVVSPTRLRAKVRTLVAQLAPESLRDAVEVVRESRRLRRSHDRVGGQTWGATLLNGESDLAWSAIDRLARRFKADGLADTLEQARADALVSLVLGSADVTVVLHVATPLGLPAPTLPTTEHPPASSHRPTLPALVPVTGLGPAVVDVDGTWLGGRVSKVQTLVVDPETGALLRPPTGTAQHDPPLTLARWVTARDGHCRFPGCDVSATRCDLDHVVPWPTGPTEATNLLTLCRHHHRVKQRPGWRITLHPSGIADWTDPHGAVHTSRPLDHRTSAAPPPTPTPAPALPTPSPPPVTALPTTSPTPPPLRSTVLLPPAPRTGSRTPTLSACRSRLEDHLALLPCDGQGQGQGELTHRDVTHRDITRRRHPGLEIDWHHLRRTRSPHARAYGPPPF